MTTKGDNKSAAKEEVRQFLLSVLPQRLANLGEETKWAHGCSMPDYFKVPPPWVKRLIRDALKLGFKPAGSPANASDTELAQLLGMVMGMSQGMSAALAETSKPEKEGNELSQEFMARASLPLKGAIQEADKTLGQVAPKAFQSNLDQLAAYAKGQNIGVDYVMRKARDDADTETVTTELQWLLWFLWPQVASARSVHEVHEWVEHLGLVHCSQKLVEKVCTQIGFRPSQRGRGRRIPTTGH